MNIKKISAAVMAAVVLAAAAPVMGMTAPLTITAHAEQAQVKLLTAKANDIAEFVVDSNALEDYERAELEGKNDLYYLGNGYYTKKHTPSKLFRVGEKEIAKWRETGKFSYIAFENDASLNDIDFMRCQFKGSCIIYSDGDKVSVLGIDDKSGKIVRRFDINGSFGAASNDGYLVSTDYDYDTQVTTVRVYDPTGKVINEKAFNSDSLYANSCSNEYFAFVVNATYDPDTYIETNREYYGIKKDGSFTVCKEEDLVTDRTEDAPKGFSTVFKPNGKYDRFGNAEGGLSLTLDSTGKTYEISGVKFNFEWLDEPSIISAVGVEGIYGTKIVLRCRHLMDIFYDVVDISELDKLDNGFIEGKHNYSSFSEVCDNVFYAGGYDYVDIDGNQLDYSTISGFTNGYAFAETQDGKAAAPSSMLPRPRRTTIPTQSTSHPLTRTETRFSLTARLS